MARASVVVREDAQASKMLDEDTLAPGQHARWVRNDPQTISSKMVKGYRYVTEEDKIKTLTGTEVKSPEGHILDGDLVLMVCDKSRVEERRRLTEENTKQRLRGPTEVFKHEHRKSGAHNSRVIEDFDDRGV